MTKKLSLFLLGGFLLLLLGCRHDLEQMDKVSTSESKAQKFSIFNFDKKTQRTPFDYAGAFAFLAQRYDSINHTNITGLVNTSNDVVYDSIKKQRFISSATEAYIEFRIHSQTVFEDNGDIWAVFPRIENNAVKELVVASLEEDETKVYYYRFDRFTDFHKENIEKFREVYAKYFHQAKSSFTGRTSVMARCGFDSSPSCAIEEIVLPRPSKGGGKGGSGVWYGGGDGESVGGGGCAPHEMCAPPNGEGGGSYNPIPVNNTDPCAKMKAQTNDAAYKEKRELLQKKTGETYEVGYRVGLPVAGSGQVGTQYQKLENRAGTSELDFKIFKTTFGIMHTHYEGLYPMFSPGDIYLFGQLLTNAQNNNIPLSDVFLSVVTPAGNYQLRFEGTHFAGWNQNFNIDQLNEDYVKEYLGDYDKGSQEKFEKEFLKFMKDNMNIEGAKLIREGENGNTQLGLDQRGNLVTNNCK